VAESPGSTSLASAPDVSVTRSGAARPSSPTPDSGTPKKIPLPPGAIESIIIDTPTGKIEIIEYGEKVEIVSSTGRAEIIKRPVGDVPVSVGPADTGPVKTGVDPDDPGKIRIQGVATLKYSQQISNTPIWRPDRQIRKGSLLAALKVNSNLIEYLLNPDAVPSYDGTTSKPEDGTTLTTPTALDTEAAAPAAPAMRAGSEIARVPAGFSDAPTEAPYEVKDDPVRVFGDQGEEELSEEHRADIIKYNKLQQAAEDLYDIDNNRIRPGHENEYNALRNAANILWQKYGGRPDGLRAGQPRFGEADHSFLLDGRLRNGSNSSFVVAELANRTEEVAAGSMTVPIAMPTRHTASHTDTAVLVAGTGTTDHDADDVWLKPMFA